VTLAAGSGRRNMLNKCLRFSHLRMVNGNFP